MNNPFCFFMRTLFCLIALNGLSYGQLVVSPAQPLTHFVKVQPVIASNSSGTSASFFGTAASEAYIKDQIDRVWAQIGIDIEWLPPNYVTSNFIYDGSSVANYTNTPRPTSHLSQIVSTTASPPKSADPKIVNLFFLRIPPGFKGADLTTYHAAGYAYVDLNGATVYVGSGLLTWQAGRDVVAAVVAHEIGHNLGLSHSTSSSNLMYASGSTAEYLDNSQKNTIFTDNVGIDGFDLVQSGSAAVPSNYEVWAGGFSLQLGPDGDDDGDRLSNAMEFLQGSDPTKFTPFPSPQSTAAGPVWNFNRNANATADGVNWQIETGNQLGGWYPAGAVGSCSSIIANTSTQISVRLNLGETRAFLRAGVTVPAGLEGGAAGIATAQPSSDSGAANLRGTRPAPMTGILPCPCPDHAGDSHSAVHSK